jgi:hypothetical protein
MPKADFEKHAQSVHLTQKAYYQSANTPDAGDADDADSKAGVIATGTDKRAATLGLDQLCNTYKPRATRPPPPQDQLTALGLTPLPLPSWTMTPGQWPQTLMTQPPVIVLMQQSAQVPRQECHAETERGDGQGQPQST